MRTYKNKIYNCKVINYDGNIIHDKDYYSLLEMSEDLGLTKATISVTSTTPSPLTSPRTAPKSV